MFKLNGIEVGFFKKRALPRVLLVGYDEDLAPYASVIIDRDPLVFARSEGSGAVCVIGDWYNLPDLKLGVFDVIMGNGTINIRRSPDESTMESLFNILRGALNEEIEAKMVFSVHLSNSPLSPEKYHLPSFNQLPFQKRLMECDVNTISAPVITWTF